MSQRQRIKCMQRKTFKLRQKVKVREMNRERQKKQVTPPVLLLRQKRVKGIQRQNRESERRNLVCPHHHLLTTWFQINYSSEEKEEEDREISVH